LELPTLFWALNVTVCPVDARGQAYLALGQGAEAAGEFQKILDHPGLVGTFPLGALAHLGLARAYGLQARAANVNGTNPATPLGAEAAGDTRSSTPHADALAKARAAYQDFFALWKTADPDLPVLKQARAEYARLQ
jgi:hypothetical protein